MAKGFAHAGGGYTSTSKSVAGASQVLACRGSGGATFTYALLVIRSLRMESHYSQQKHFDLEKPGKAFGV